MSVQFTTDGYIEPMKPRVGGLVAGAVVTLASFPLLYVSACISVPCFFIGIGMLANERGKRRYRVTRTKLLIEDEPLIRGFVIGPIRNRIPWEQVKSAERAGPAVKLVTNDGELVLGEGGTEQELEKFLGRIQLSLEED